MIEIFIILTGIAAEHIIEIMFEDRSGQTQAIALPEAPRTKGSQVTARNPKLKDNPRNLDFVTGLLGMNDPRAVSSSGKRIPVQAMSVSKNGKNVFNYQRQAQRRTSGSSSGGRAKENESPDFFF